MYECNNNKLVSFFSFSSDRVVRTTAGDVSVCRVADVRVHVRADTGRPDGVGLEAYRGRVVRGHRDRRGLRRPVWLRDRARRVRARPVAGGHALNGAHARGRRMFRHGRCRCGARRVTARRHPMGAERATHQTGTFYGTVYYDDIAYRVCAIAKRSLKVK